MFGGMTLSNLRRWIGVRIYACHGSVLFVIYTYLTSCLLYPVHRISQTRKVQVLRFVMKGSIEERIIKVQERKSLQAKSVVQKLQGDEKKKALIGDLRGLLDIDQN